MKTEFRAPAALLAVALGASALAGCGSSNDTVVAENASVEDVAKQVSKVNIKPSPGRWESQMQIVSIDMPNLPPQVQGAMKQQMGKVQTSISCLTQEEADKADGAMFKPQDDGGCQYNKFAMGSGKINADMTCEQGKTSQNMVMSGTYSEDAYSMQMKSEGMMEGNPIAMEMKVDSKRVGDCDGSENS